MNHNKIDSKPLKVSEGYTVGKLTVKNALQTKRTAIPFGAVNANAETKSFWIPERSSAGQSKTAGVKRVQSLIRRIWQEFALENLFVLNQQICVEMAEVQYGYVNAIVEMLV